MEDWTFPATVEEGDSEVVVTFRDVPGAIGGGPDRAAALTEGRKALAEMLVWLAEDGAELPSPSRARRGETPVSVPAVTAAKLALFAEMKRKALRQTELAVRLGCDAKEVRRILDFGHPTKMARLEAALEAVGVRLGIRTDRAA